MIFQSLLLASLTFSLQQREATAQSDTSIFGRITAADTTSAMYASAASGLGSVIVDVSVGGAVVSQTTTDESGAYALLDLSAGAYTLHFARAGYLPLTLDVRVPPPPDAAVHLDITLDPLPPALQTVTVVAKDGLPRIPSAPNSLGAYRPWRIDGDQLRTTPSLDFPDVTRALGMSPDAPGGPESGGGLHLQGGSTDHTLLLVDGIPLYNATHAGDHPSAIDPDAVADVTSYSQPRARSGGALSGVVEVNTLTSLPDSQHVSMSIWPTGIRTLAQVPFAGGSALIGARRNYARPLERNEREPVTFTPNDLFTTITVPFVTGSLTGMAFSSGDAIAFDAGQSTTVAGARVGNRFDWSSDARAITWRGPTNGKVSMEARVWQSGTAVGADWIPSSADRVRLSNSFTQTAGASSVSWGGNGEPQTSVGLSVEELRARYAVTGEPQVPLSPTWLGVRSRLQVTSAFLEHSRSIGKHVTATLGERIAVVGELGTVFEPRLALTFSAPSGARLSAAFARTHQFTQSFYNDESVVDAMASLEVPVLAGGARVPIASSSSASAKLDMPVGGATLLTISGFARSYTGLVLPGPSGGGPFAARTFTAGNGNAYGATFGAHQQRGRLELQGSYSMVVVSREWGGEQQYRPTFAPSHDLLLAAGYKLGANTFLRASGFMAAYRSTSPLVGAIAWEWQDALATQREVSGSPQYSPNGLGVGRLAPYVRFDIGARHDLQFGGPLRGRASIYANVDNLLDRRNALGIVTDPSGMITRRLGMVPRSLSFGLGLRF
ncbi:MAG TPA: TonB-dependent receptor [Gemmatimonadaceae bacterium]|nr:TonB-dependent receptor [Gemmatimonadaceae bacterium]